MNKAIEILKRWAKKSRGIGVFVVIGYVLREKCVNAIFLIFDLLPLQDKVVFCAMTGKRYGDNPAYICNELIKKTPDIDVVWLLDKDLNVNLPNGVRRIPFSGVQAIYELATAKVWVDSNMKRTGFVKRAGQRYILTWHGSYGIKKIGFDQYKISEIEKRTTIANINSTDLMISNSKRTTEIYRRAFAYHGEMYEFGSCRNDIFFDDRGPIKESIETIFNCINKKILLYAPTFRNDYSTDFLSIDFQRLRTVLYEKTNEEWVIFVRMHYNNLIDAENAFSSIEGIIDVSKFDDMQKLLVAADVLITDYSSCMFDFVTIKKPCIIYAPDLLQYESDRGNYYRMEDLPFPLAQNNDELEDIIVAFDEKKYHEGITELHEQVGLCETGHASEAVVDYIVDFIKNGKE